MKEVLQITNDDVNDEDINEKYLLFMIVRQNHRRKKSEKTSQEREKFQVMSEIQAQLKVQKFAGKWKQESTENVEALNKKLGLNWAIRKVANVMDVNIEIVANPEVSSNLIWLK